MRVLALIPLICGTVLSKGNFWRRSVDVLEEVETALVNGVAGMLDDRVTSDTAIPEPGKTVLLGHRNYRMKCNLTGTDPIMWFRGGTQLSASTGAILSAYAVTYVIQDSDPQTIIIQEVKAVDDTEWRCQQLNNATAPTWKWILTVAEPPTNCHLSYNNELIEMGTSGNISYSCTIAKPPPRIRFFIQASSQWVEISGSDHVYTQCEFNAANAPTKCAVQGNLIHNFYGEDNGRLFRAQADLMDWKQYAMQDFTVRVDSGLLNTVSLLLISVLVVDSY